MPQRRGVKRFDNPRKNKPNKESQQGASALDENNPILSAFHGYAQELDAKHDRYERVVKFSRDITIESKRIIFFLHTIDERKQNKAKVLAEAQQRLDKVIEVNFKAVARELIGQDPYQYRAAYSPGLQEFIEAYSFMEYFRNDTDATDGCGLSDWAALQRRMQYEEKVEEKRPEPTDAERDGQTSAPTVDETPPSSADVRTFEFFIDPTEYILGLSDLTGELMRRCINSLGSGETDACMETCKALQNFYTGYISLNVLRCRELSRKIYTMRQSVLKSENVCYNVRVRGGEAAKWGAVFDNKPNDDDEGFF